MLDTSQGLLNLYFAKKFLIDQNLDLSTHYSLIKSAFLFPSLRFLRNTNRESTAARILANTSKVIPSALALSHLCKKKNVPDICNKLNKTNKQ